LSATNIYSREIPPICELGIRNPSPAQPSSSSVRSSSSDHNSIGVTVESTGLRLPGSAYRSNCGLKFLLSVNHDCSLHVCLPISYPMFHRGLVCQIVCNSYLPKPNTSILIFSLRKSSLDTVHIDSESLFHSEKIQILS
jgi:hypothetical protein